VPQELEGEGRAGFHYDADSTGALTVNDIPFEIRGGPRAIAHVRENGLSPGDIGCIPAAAGGPKGLALIPLDRLLYREWLRDATGIELVGASVGAWRMAALAQPDPVAALDRLEHAYVREQKYTVKPGPDEVSRVIRKVAAAVLGGAGSVPTRPGVALTIITSRARGCLTATESKAAFARAMLSNAVSRSWLASHLERVLFHSGEPSFLRKAYDAFGLERITLDAHNAEDALLASGTIPLLCSPVRDIHGAPRGFYWDGALVDYHLLLPYPWLQDGGAGGRTRVVFYPHFSTQVTPGWLDKHLPWRRHATAHPWLDNVLVIAPSPGFLARLPNRKLPDRNDFYQYGAEQDRRISDWERAISECGRFAEAVVRWLQRPDPTLIRPI
jgi:hypothetical protein